MANTTKNSGEKQIPSILDKITLLPSDKVLGVIIALLFAISLIVVYSSSAQVAYRHGLSTEFYLQKHIITLLGTAAVMLLAYLIPVKVIRWGVPLLYVVAIGLTIAAYFIGHEGEDAWRTLPIGPIKFQPSEILKVATVMLVADQLSRLNINLSKVHLLPTTFNVKRWWKDPKQRNIIFREMLPILLPIGLSCAVILPAHNSSTLILFIITMFMLYVAGIKKREMAKVVVVALVVALPIMFLFGRGDTAEGRISRFFKSEVDYSKTTMDKYNDAFRAKMAVHNGGPLGVGAGHSVMRARLTHPESDYLFSLVVEELGSIIAFIIILLYLWIFFRSIRIFDNCQWLYAGLLVMGLALILLVHAFVHIAVSLGCMPETGQNLPFLTQGRTSMWIVGGVMGLILGISRQVLRGTLVPSDRKSAQSKL